MWEVSMLCFKDHHISPFLHVTPGLKMKIFDKKSVGDLYFYNFLQQSCEKMKY